MAIKKKSVTCTGTASLVQTLDLGAAYAKVHKFTFLSNVDTSVSCDVVDAEGKVVFTLASGDYTAAGAQQLPNFYVSALETQIRDTGGDLNADTEGMKDVIAASPLTLTAAGLDAAETLDVAVYVEI